MNRNFPAVSYTVEHTTSGIVVRTDRLRIVYDEKPFSPNGLSVALVGYENAHTGNWYYGDAVHDLKGTARTLDTVDGDNVELGHGLISTEGYAVLDDSESLALQDDGWVELRNSGAVSYTHLDVYKRQVHGAGPFPAAWPRKVQPYRGSPRR